MNVTAGVVNVYGPGGGNGPGLDFGNGPGEKTKENVAKERFWKRMKNLFRPGHEDNLFNRFKRAPGMMRGMGNWLKGGILGKRFGLFAAGGTELGLLNMFKGGAEKPAVPETPNVAPEASPVAPETPHKTKAPPATETPKPATMTPEPTSSAAPDETGKPATATENGAKTATNDVVKEVEMDVEESTSFLSDFTKKLPIIGNTLQALLAYSDIKDEQEKRDKGQISQQEFENQRSSTLGGLAGNLAMGLLSAPFFLMAQIMKPTTINDGYNPDNTGESMESRKLREMKANGTLNAPVLSDADKKMNELTSQLDDLNKKMDEANKQKEADQDAAAYDPTNADGTLSAAGQKYQDDISKMNRLLDQHNDLLAKLVQLTKEGNDASKQQAAAVASAASK
jgi:hypothetical protein